MTRITDFNSLTGRLVSIGNVVIYLLVGLAIIYIVWAVVQYFIKGKEGDESRREAGMNILWGIVGLAIIVSLWGLVNILVRTFATDTNRPALPNANFLDSSQAGASQYSQPIGPGQDYQQYSQPIGPGQGYQQYSQPIGPGQQVSAPAPAASPTNVSTGPNHNSVSNPGPLP